MDQPLKSARRVLVRPGLASRKFRTLLNATIFAYALGGTRVKSHFCPSLRFPEKKVKTTNLSRRRFLSQTACAGFAVGCAGSWNGRPAEADIERDRGFEEWTPPKIPSWLASEANELLTWITAHGWFERIQWLGPRPASVEDPLLFAPRDLVSCDGFNDFYGRRLIHPGRPELSALYHALACGEVRLEDPTTPAVQDDYASIEQLDTLENFIYALGAPPHVPGATYRLAVLAYEYRRASMTPHRLHADLVFSRTGISRVGSEPLQYDRAQRAFVTLAPDPTKVRHVAVTGARYGLFLVRIVGVSESTFMGMPNITSGDLGRQFVRPVRKVFSRDPFLTGRKLEFVGQFRSEQLRRLAMFSPNGPGTDRLKTSPGMSINDAPFIRSCDVSAGAGPSRLAPLTNRGSAPIADPLVDFTAHGSSVVVSSPPARLARFAKQGAALAAFLVPEKSRRYSSYKLTNRSGHDSVDAARTQALFRSARTNDFDVPRNAPLFANIRYEMRAPDWKPFHLDETYTGNFDDAVNAGHWAALFEDSICDGCVVAKLSAPEPIDGKVTEPPVEFWEAIRNDTMPGFSLVTAPDFFPNIAPMDLDGVDAQAADVNFLAGGTAPLSLTRIRANPALRVPGVGKPAFSSHPSQRALEETITAVVSSGAKEVLPITAIAGRTGFLPDAASAFFFPGWDATYSADSPEGSPETFLATYGLGSPFPEDMKLCAAANGMWPAASPDATRTFQGSLEAAFGFGPATAVPLLDCEIGYHPRSPARMERRLPADSGFHVDSRGWDGEYGPYLEWVSDELHVNCADIRRVDYVKNALDDRFDASRLRNLRTEELIARMDALRRCIRAYDGPPNTVLDPHNIQNEHAGRIPRDSHLWLVNAEAVTDWIRPALGLGLPALLRPAFVTPNLKKGGPGYLFVFAVAFGPLRYFVDQQTTAGQTPDPEDWKRVRRQCRELYVCQATETHLVTARWQTHQGNSARSPRLTWRRYA